MFKLIFALICLGMNAASMVVSFNKGWNFIAAVCGCVVLYFVREVYRILRGRGKDYGIKFQRMDARNGQLFRLINGQLQPVSEDSAPVSPDALAMIERLIVLSKMVDSVLKATEGVMKDQILPELEANKSDQVGILRHSLSLNDSMFKAISHVIAKAESQLSELRGGK